VLLVLRSHFIANLLFLDKTIDVGGGHVVMVDNICACAMFVIMITNCSCNDVDHSACYRDHMGSTGG
jgi:hypothetical protein